MMSNFDNTWVQAFVPEVDLGAGQDIMWNDVAQWMPPVDLSTDVNSLNTEPNNPSVWELLGKVGIGLVVWILIAGLLFVILSFVGGMFTDAIQQQWPQISVNPLLWLILLFIWFLSSFIGNMIVSGVYSLFFGKKYYDLSKMLWFLLLTNAILFLVLLPIYMLFKGNIDTLFLLLWFHILFSVFVSANQIEFLSNPNYSGSALMWNVLWFALALLIYGMVYKLSKVSSVQQQTYFLMLLPSVLWFTLIPFGGGIWEKIYYSLYSMWSNAFYIPSLSEVSFTMASDDGLEDEDINVEM